MYARLVVQQHIRDNGFWKKYKTWEKHGEVEGAMNCMVEQDNDSDYMEDDMVRLVHEALGGPGIDAPDHTNEENQSEPPLEPNESTKRFFKLLESTNLPLYPGSKKHTVLSFKFVYYKQKFFMGGMMNVPNGYRDVCMKSCNDLWKNHKSKTKTQYFEPRKYDPNLENDPPTHIVAEQWVDLVAYWRTEEVEKKSKLSSIAQELHGPLHTTGRKHSAQLRLVEEEFENYLLNEPENHRGLAVVKDRIFHHIMGKDRHGYCHTFGSSMPRSLVYPKSSSFENTTDLLKMIYEQLNQFGERLEKLEARVISIENKERNTNETKRRDKLNQRMKTLQKLVPSSSKAFPISSH
ncbi:hypothetical protein LINPERPRIM_LOCUS29891 [Linum perenne]